MTQKVRASSEDKQTGRPAGNPSVEMPVPEQWSCETKFVAQSGVAGNGGLHAQDHESSAGGGPGQPVPGSKAYDEWVASRRKQIAKRSNAYYEHRARITRQQNRRALRVALFVCSVIALVGVAFATNLMMRDDIKAYFSSMGWPGDEAKMADLSGSGSVYMSPQAPAPAPAPTAAREPAAPPLEVVHAGSGNSLPPGSIVPVIQPAGEKAPAADEGLLENGLNRQAEKPAPDAPTAALESPVEPAPVQEKPAAVKQADEAPAQNAPGKKVAVVAALDPAPVPAAADKAVKQEKQQNLMSPREARELLRRGDRLMKLGDIISARALYVRVLETDQTSAALRLGSTYDPLVFQQMGVHGLRPDADTAMKWYLTSAEAGNDDARRAYAALKRHTGQ